MGVQTNVTVLTVLGVVNAALRDDPDLETPEKVEQRDNGFRLVTRLDGLPVYVDVHFP